MNMRQKSALRACALAVVCLQVLATTGYAQLAPTGTHYAGRSSDTGHSGVASSGGYATSVALDLPAARGGMAVPVALSYGRRGVGAGGLGWDVPLSYVRREGSIARRRPAYVPSAIQAREQMVVSLAGRTVQMVRDGSVWVARQDATDLELTAELGNQWRLRDGNGQEFLFTASDNLGGADLWLLSSVTSATGSNRIDLKHEVTPHSFSSGSGFSIDLVSVRYNTHPSTPDCAKNEIQLRYSDPVTEPLSILLLDDTPIVRMRTLRDVRVLATENCTSNATELRRYELGYSPDPDTGQPRLSSVRLFGRAGTPEGNTSLPVASYGYGTATESNKLRYQRGTDIPLPADLTGTPPIASTYHDSSASSPDGGKTYVTWQNLVDMTGDGRPDLVYSKNGSLWVAANRPTPVGATSLNPGIQLDGSVLTSGPLASHASEAIRYGFNFQNVDHVWRQTIDVNGDGRLDIIDATEEDNAWTVYLNTPGSPATWEKRTWRVDGLRAILEARGHAIDGNRVPLARRTTGYDTWTSYCYRWDVDTQRYVPYPEGFQNGACVDVPQRRAGREKTFNEWELRDVNGDGYPDVVLNSSPVRHVTYVPEEFVSGTWPDFGDQVRDVLRPNAEVNAVEVMFNIVGVRIDGALTPFSQEPITLDYGQCGVGLWEDSCDVDSNTCDEGRQSRVCGIEDVNGDGMADRIENGFSVRLGNGDSFPNPGITIELPGWLRQFNPQAKVCASAPWSTEFDPRQLAALRDLTGDGIPDFITSESGGWQISIGTGTGFATPVPIELPVSAAFAISTSIENCGGTFSNTISGLYDVDGDGKPEVVHASGLQLEVYHLAGVTPGNPQAGRLSTIDNGYGAITSITYRSAKEDTSTPHQVPFPEIVVTSVETTGSYGLGGTLSAVRYAYGDASMFFDPGVDAFTLRGYGRSVEVHGKGYEDWDADYAIVRVANGLPDFTSGMDDAARFERYQKAGRLADTYVLGHGVERDPWELLGSFDPVIDTRRIAGMHHEWKTEYVPLQDPDTSIDCFDVMYPYDWSLSAAHNVGKSPCYARGFTYTRSAESWYGTQPPGSSASNVQTRFEVTKVDAFGNVLEARNENDVFVPDDDVCIYTTYAAPSASARILSAPATRRITDCLPGEEEHTLSTDSWEYDRQPVGQLTLGRATSHTVASYATDNGEPQDTIRSFEADHDLVGNPNYIVTAREDGAVRALQVQYDAFGLAPIAMTLDASGLDPLVTQIVRDPHTLAVLSTTDANGTTWGIEFDGFGRELFTSVEPPPGSGKPAGVVSSTTYIGFLGADPSGRSITTKTFREPVAPTAVASTPGQELVARLDELGRTWRVERRLGADYNDETLVTLARTYDDLGRVSFEADPHPASQGSATAYGTTYHFGTDATLKCSIRGPGPQPLTASTNTAAEIFPTCFTRTFSNNQLQVTVQKPDALESGSPQQGVAYTDTMSAIGWLLSRETVQNGARLELSRYAYDHLGQLVGLTRFNNPSTASEPVGWTWRLDSRGRTLTATEPDVAPRSFTYSHWDELLSVDWNDGGIPLRLARSYDALGRIVHAAELRDSYVVPETEYEWRYDGAPNTVLPDATFTAGRLTQTTSSLGDMHLSYDAYGRVEARAFEAEGERYFERFEHHFDGALRALELQLADTGYESERYEYEYDSASRLRSVVDRFHDGGSVLYVANDIDAWGRVRSAVYGSGTSFSANYATTGRRLPLDHAITTNQSRRGVAYLAYDAIGRELDRREETESVDTITTSRYDALGRLARSGKSPVGGGASQYDSTFTYDPLGNVRRLDEAVSNDLVNLAFSTSDRDRICRIDFGAATTGPCNVHYDGSGNIIEQPTPNGTRVHEFYPSGGVQRIEQNAVTANFRYDGSGEMFALDVAGAFLADARRDRRYGLIERRDAEVNGAIESIMVRNIPGPNGIIASRRGAADGRWIFPFGEQRGTRVASDGESFVQDVDYLPFGKATSTGATPGQPEYTNYQWNGGDALADLGLVHLGARLYDPTLGRFLSRDPMILPGSASSANPYAFALNDPVNLSDPTGLCPESPTGCYQPLTPLLPPFANSNSDSGVADLIVGRKLLSMIHDPIPEWDGTLRNALPHTHELVGWGYRNALRNSPPLSWEMVNRGLKIVAGTAVAFFGAKLCTTGIGCVIGRAMMLAGADYVGSGISGGPTAASQGGPILQATEDALVLGAGLLSMVPSATLGFAENGVRLASGMGGGSAPATIVRTIPRGEKVTDIVAEAKALTFATGNEHALVSLTTGERVLVSGGPTGIDLGGLPVRRLIGHTHPYHLAPTGPSAADLDALRRLGQRSSYLLEHGILIKFWLGGP